MSDQGPITAPKGQASDTPDTGDGTTTGTPSPDQGTSQTAPQVDGGQAKTDGSDKQTAPDTTVDTETFFDPKDLPPELVPIYKSMQSSFTKGKQAIKKEREKIDAYDAFMADVPGNLQRAAQQYGFRMVPIQGNPPQAGVEGNQPFGPDWQPGSYEELFQAFVSRLTPELRKQFGPVFENVQKMATSNAERQLSEIDPDWRIYEDDMTENLRKHPTLAHDIPKLYKMSVPDEVLNSRAVQTALKKQEAKVKTAKIQGGGTTAPTSRPKGGKMDFSQAVEQAKTDLAEQGLTP